MLRRKNHKKKTLGQTALEYVLVIAVIAVGVVVIGKAVFSEKGSPTETLMRKAVEEAQKTFAQEE